MVLFRCLMKGYCCKKYWIPVTHLDLLRIEIYAKVDIKPDMLSLYDASLYEDLQYPQIIFNSKKYFLALSSKEDGSCIFLSKDGKCSIHPYKPLVCRFYPFVYIENDNGDIDIDLNDNAIGECPGIILDDKPIPDNIRKEYLRLAKARILELKLWKHVADEWNSSLYSSKSFESVANIFLEFIMSRAREDMKKLMQQGLWIP
ncbi:MAG: YkgJ family cysteine cluster protein [Ignisphaera sp.]|nr:YkgJ family cysteine cluster protein [Ignisphaera sp.]